MLMNRSRAVTSKQALMADQTSFLSPTKNPSSPISTFLGSPRFFNGLLSKNLFDSEITAMSPTSILDTKNSTFVNPFGYDRTLSKYRPPSPDLNSTNKTESEALGLALIDSIIEEKLNENDGKFSKPINRMALLGSKLKVQIPAANLASPLSPIESPKSPADFGVKTRNSQLSSPFNGSPAKDFSRQLSLKEMELSEDYTCVITHGPNPKTTHIYDDCIVESFVGYDEEIPEDKGEDCGIQTNVSTSSSPNFLSFCHTCKDVLGEDRDIYIYSGCNWDLSTDHVYCPKWFGCRAVHRIKTTLDLVQLKDTAMGEKAFCSQDCRYKKMVLEGMKNSGLDDAF